MTKIQHYQRTLFIGLVLILILLAAFFEILHWLTTDVYQAPVAILKS